MQNNDSVDYISILTQKPIMSILEIKKLLPHRYPFLLIDKVMSLNTFKDIIAVKNITSNEQFFNGHFPNYPIMPGVLMLEAMAQACGILGVKSAIEKHNLSIDNPPNVFLMSMDDVKFRSPAFPGDSIVFHCVMEKARSEICICNCKAFVLDKKICEAKITAKFAFV